MVLPLCFVAAATCHLLSGLPGGQLLRHLIAEQRKYLY